MRTGMVPKPMTTLESLHAGETFISDKGGLCPTSVYALINSTSIAAELQEDAMEPHRRYAYNLTTGTFNSVAFNILVTKVIVNGVAEDGTLLFRHA